MTGISEDMVDSGTTERIAAFAQNLADDPALRSRAASEPRAVLTEHGIRAPEGRELRIAANTADTFHVVLPPDPNSALADVQLDAVAGGSSTAQRTVQSFKSASTIISCFACAS